VPVKLAARSELNLHGCAQTGTQMQLSNATRRRGATSLFMGDDFLCVK
jgi:hypothetical protein